MALKIKVKPLLKYTLTPQVLPRIKGLFFSGFSYIAFFMAQIYRAARILPQDHPYLNAANMGKFGLRHVIVEAGNNLVFKKENLDQIAIYLLLVFGMVIMAAQLFMLMVAGFVDIAHAGAMLYPSSTPLDFFLYFQTPIATHELAFVLLDRVFGIPGPGGPGTSFFADINGGFTCVVEMIRCFDLGYSTIWDNSSASDGIDRLVAINYERTGFVALPFPWPYHDALRGMLQFYSVGLLVIGVCIFLYFVFAVAMETAQTGTAFGRRFNHIWAPFRIVIAMGLLVPITFGLNPAQWILMYMVKWGSSFATNGWVIYNNAITSEDTPLGSRETLVARPRTPPVNTLIEFGSILSACKISYERIYHERAGRAPPDIQAWIINPEDVTLAPLLLDFTPYEVARGYENGGAIHVRFGELRGGYHQSWDGRVVPFCGELTLDTTYVPEGLVTPGCVDSTEPGSCHVLMAYYYLTVALWFDAKYGITNFLNIWNTLFGVIGAGCCPVVQGYAAQTSLLEIGTAMADRHIGLFNNAPTPVPTPEELTSLVGAYSEAIDQQVVIGVARQRQSDEWDERYLELGWAGAAIWYNKIAQLNGGLVSSVYAMPTIKSYPHVMEMMEKDRSGSDDGISGETIHRSYRGTDNVMDIDDESNNQIAKVLYETRSLWRDNYFPVSREGNILIDTINTIFGTEGLFSILDNENMDVHPLAQLASIGKSIIESAVRNLGYSVAAGLSGGIANLFQQHNLGSFGNAGASFLFQVAMIGLSIGFVLYYVIPFLPFIYFFFAVGGWIKGIFEAMVGVPLWALAHIRIDGEGMPPDAAMGGYYLILEIFLRPILIIFGFIASVTIFGAQVRILHEIWYLVVSNVSGSGPIAIAMQGAAPDATGSIDYLRSAVDEFFFTIIYAIVCYMMGMGSFKLIDQVPNHMLRWMGASVQSFGNDIDPADNLVRNSFMGASMISGPLRQAAGGMKQGLASGSAAVGEIFGRAGR